MKKIIYFLVILLLIVLIAISSYFIYKQLKEENEQELIFDDLCKIIQEDEKNQAERNFVTNNDINLNDIYNQNNDLVGWLKIDDTNINYPVMQTKNNEEYYLRKNFYKKYSSYGTPFISASYNKDSSENMIIYGHHMNNMKMFGVLEKYKSVDFYNKHKIIKFYTLNNTQEYEIFSVFKTTLYQENSFKYYQNIELDTEAGYKNFINNCISRSFYNTGIKPEYKNKLLTLSTCEYSAKNSRLVVVGVLKENL